MKPHKPFWGLLQRRECLVPTLRGWALMLVTAMTLAVIVVGNLHSFLTVTAPAAGEVLVVEGWAPDYLFEETVVEFKRHPYKKVYVTGGPLEQGSHLSEYKTYAELGATILLRMGLDRETVQAVPSSPVRQDRTHAAAVALNNWLRRHNAMPANLNVVSLGAHSRRSWLLFQKVFGGNTRVGIIAIEDRDYDPKHWYKTSLGVRLVTDEAIAYLYARFVFSSPKEPQTAPTSTR
ncbi:MAG: YdcF family protein [Verrucomicrobia bacterium]|nr:YdcF family protein [Verrucomicrobiota bacterium]